MSFPGRWRFSADSVQTTFGGPPLVGSNGLSMHAALLNSTLVRMLSLLADFHLVVSSRSLAIIYDLLIFFVSSFDRQPEPFLAPSSRSALERLSRQLTSARLTFFGTWALLDKHPSFDLFSDYFCRRDSVRDWLRDLIWRPDTSKAGLSELPIHKPRFTVDFHALKPRKLFSLPKSTESSPGDSEDPGHVRPMSGIRSDSSKATLS